MGGEGGGKEDWEKKEGRGKGTEGKSEGGEKKNEKERCSS